jgi:ribonucrease Y
MDIITLILFSVVGAGVGAYVMKKTGKKGNIPVSLTSVDTPVQENKNQDVAVKPVVSTVDTNAMLVDARAQARELIIEAKAESLKIKTSAEDDVRHIKEKVLEVEKRITMQKAQIEAKEKDIESKIATLKKTKESMDKKQEELNSFYEKQQQELQKVALLTKDEAKHQLLSVLDRELAEEKGRRIREKEEELKHESDKLAQEILVSAMRFAASDYIVEYTTSKVKLPDEEMKGRIIGKEGRNIRTFEELTGVDLDMDSTPGEVLISSFDPVRREIARLSLEKLITDGRIQPAHIEEVVEKTKSEVEHIMYKEGDNLCHKVGAYNIPKELIQMLGRFKYRFSYGQNMLEHTLEETRLGVAIAHELNANVEIVRLGCLFHDIGKVVTDDEGTHIDLGVDLLRKYKISDDVVNCVAEHHEDKPFSSIESAIVNLADHISGARPGARSEDYESYVKRLKDLEGAATSYDGVEKAYAVSAGREVRVFVSPDKVDDASTAYLAREIAKKIELEQTYPGVVKVTVIRETRVTETAK